MQKKYEFTDERHPNSPGLRRIRALEDIPRAGVRAGDLGGWIEREENLHHDGAAWISGTARVYGNARVFDNALVFDNVRIYGDAQVYGTAQVFGNSQVYGTAQVLHTLVQASSIFPATLFKTSDEVGHHLIVGCWEGSVPNFREMIESDRWVDATPAEIKKHRPELLAFIAMCEARMQTWGGEGEER